MKLLSNPINLQEIVEFVKLRMHGFQKQTSRSLKDKNIGNVSTENKNLASTKSKKISELEEFLLCPKFVVKKIDITSTYGSSLRLYFNKDDLIKNLQIYLETPNDLLI